MSIVLVCIGSFCDVAVMVMVFSKPDRGGRGVVLIVICASSCGCNVIDFGVSVVSQLGEVVCSWRK